MMKRLAFVGGSAAIALALGASTAHAHGLLSSSQPADGAQLSSAPSDVVLSFTETPDPRLSSIRVFATSGADVHRGNVKAVPGHPRELTVALQSLPNGVYTVTWRIVSRVDGHVTGGAFAFGVGEPVGNVVVPSGPSVPRPSVLSVAGRALYYGGLVILIGTAVAALFVFGTPFASSSQLVRSGLTLGVAGLATLAEAQRRSAGVTFGAFARTSLGEAVAWRAAPLVVAIVVVVLVRGRNVGAVAGIAGALSFLAHVAAGHASEGRWRWVKIAVQWVHTLSAGVWIGGLIALLAGIRTLSPEARARAVRRFSGIALFGLLGVAGTGVARAVGEVGSWRMLTGSSFGQVVIAKSALLLVLFGLGALNRYRSVPRAAADPSLLERVSRIEIAIAVAIFSLTGILSGVAPGRSVEAAERAKPKPLVINGADFGTTTRFRLAVFPGTPGRNSFEARIRDYDSGAPIEAERVSLRFTFLDEPLAGGSVLALTKSAPGVYRAAGTALSLDGRWRVTVVIERGVESVEIPLELQTRSPPQQIRVIPGTPTLYDITLSEGRSVQMYADPGKAGRPEVHATFFQNGNAFPGLRDISFTARAGSGVPLRLTFGTLDVGHFVAAAQLAPGTWTFTVRATAPDGARYVAHFEQKIA